MKDKAEVRRAIIEASGTVFSRFGYKKTTMEDIAKTFDMGKSSLYYYFNSKEEIFKAVVVYEAELLKKELRTVLTTTQNPRRRLKNYILVRMQTLRKLSNYYNAVFSEDLSHFDFIEKIRQKYDSEEIQTLKWILDEGAKMEVFKVENTELAATAISTAMKGLEIPLFWKNKDPDLESRLDDLLLILFYGIMHR
jgi:AcrR family transcriptional regulator